MEDSSAEQSDQPEPTDTDVESQPASGRPRRRWLRLIAVAALTYVVVCGVVMWMESRLIFPGAYFDPGRWIDSDRFTPDQPQVGKVTTLTYEAVDGSTLNSRLLLGENADRTILFLHGNGIHAKDMDGWTQRLSDAMNANVLTAEYRGYQGEGFHPSEQSVVDDAVRAIDVLSETTQTPVEQITVYGRSLGGGVASGLVNRLKQRGDSIRSLVLDRTFDSVVEVGRKMFFFLPVKLLLKNRFDSVEHLAQYTGPLVQIHGVPDKIVPMKNGQRLHTMMITTYKHWIEVPDMRHNDRLPLTALQEAYETLQQLEQESVADRDLL